MKGVGADIIETLRSLLSELCHVIMHLYLVQGVIISDNKAFSLTNYIIGWPNSYVSIRRAMFPQHEQDIELTEMRCMRLKGRRVKI